MRGRLFGTYESLDGGELAEALEDFTGGVVENVQLIVDGYRGDKDKCAALYEMLLAESENKALCAAYIPVRSQSLLRLPSQWSAHATITRILVKMWNHMAQRDT